MKITKENDLKRELEKVKKKEERFLNRSSLRNPLKEAIYEKVPEKLQKVKELLSGPLNWFFRRERR